MQANYYIEVECLQKNSGKQIICGDVFMSEKIKEEGRTLLVLSDGLGSGVKANVLGTLTASMVLNYMRVNKDIRKAAEIIMKTLPVCSEQEESYSTFTIVDVECDGETRIIRYDSPECLILRGLESFYPKCEELNIEGANNLGKRLYSYRFKAEKEDRIVFCSDGVTNSGVGTKHFPLGWGIDRLNTFVKGLVKRQPFLSAKQLGRLVVDRAVANDVGVPKDDISCAVVYFREPRDLLLCTGPPYDPSKDTQWVSRVKAFKGKKIVCGGTTARILAREFNESLKTTTMLVDSELPPISYLKGIDLLTEGILTLSKVHRLLKNYNQNATLGQGAADEIVRMLLESDRIEIINGTNINVAHQDPNLPVELENRRTVVKNIATLLEEKFLKEVNLSYT